jgi:hypothetical protein
MDDKPATLADIEKIRITERKAENYKGDGTNISDVLEKTLNRATELGIKVSKLPLRLIRDMESLSRLNLREQDSQSELFQPVNHKGQSFVESKSIIDVAPNKSLNNIGLELFTKKVDSMKSFAETHDMREYTKRHTVSEFLKR